jgi:hypothetical protein
MLLRVLAILLVVSSACGSDDKIHTPLPEPTPEPEPSPTPEPTPMPEPTVTFERLDTASECDGLLPTTAPLPVAFTRSMPAGEECAGGVSDGTGNVALIARRAPSDLDVVAVSSDGRTLGTFDAQSVVLPQPEGWHVVHAEGDPDRPKVWLRAIAPDGAVARETKVSPDNPNLNRFYWQLSEDPLGGSLLMIRLWSAGPFLYAHRFDAAGAPLWPALGIEVAYERHVNVFAGAVARDGAALVGNASYDWHFMWIDRAGQVVIDGLISADVLGGEGAPNSALPPPIPDVPPVIKAPLLDGSIAMTVNGEWKRQYWPLAASTTGAPPWLSARSAQRFRFTRGNRGYAFFPVVGTLSADCTQSIELLAPSGRLCGRIVLHEDGAGCTTGAVDQGWDGTVVQQSGHDACRYRWWPRLLAGD